jgi:hypothetical protein
MADEQPQNKKCMRIFSRMTAGLYNKTMNPVLFPEARK